METGSGEEGETEKPERDPANWRNAFQRMIAGEKRGVHKTLAKVREEVHEGLFDLSDADDQAEQDHGRHKAKQFDDQDASHRSSSGTRLRNSPERSKSGASHSVRNPDPNDQDEISNGRDNEKSDEDLDHSRAEHDDIDDGDEVDGAEVKAAMHAKEQRIATLTREIARLKSTRRRIPAASAAQQSDGSNDGAGDMTASTGSSDAPASVDDEGGSELAPDLVDSDGVPWDSSAVSVSDADSKGAKRGDGGLNKGDAVRRLREAAAATLARGLVAPPSAKPTASAADEDWNEESTAEDDNDGAAAGAAGVQPAGKGLGRGTEGDSKDSDLDELIRAEDLLLAGGGRGGGGRKAAADAFHQSFFSEPVSPPRYADEHRAQPPVRPVSHLPPSARPFRCMFDGAELPTATALCDYIRRRHAEVLGGQLAPGGGGDTFFPRDRMGHIIAREEANERKTEEHRLRMRAAALERRSSAAAGGTFASSAAGGSAVAGGDGGDGEEGAVGDGRGVGGAAGASARRVHGSTERRPSSRRSSIGQGSGAAGAASEASDRRVHSERRRSGPRRHGGADGTVGAAASGIGRRRRDGTGSSNNNVGREGKAGSGDGGESEDGMADEAMLDREIARHKSVLRVKTRQRRGAAAGGGTGGGRARQRGPAK